MIFWNRRKIDKDMIPKISFSSKATLKKEALLMANGDVERATSIYNFLIKDMDEIPSADPIPVSKFTQIKDTTANVFGWVKENKDDILSLIDMFKNIKKGGNGGVPTSPLPKL